MFQRALFGDPTSVTPARVPLWETNQARLTILWGLTSIWFFHLAVQTAVEAGWRVWDECGGERPQFGRNRLQGKQNAGAPSFLVIAQHRGADSGAGAWMAWFPADVRTVCR